MTKGAQEADAGEGVTITEGSFKALMWLGCSFIVAALVAGLLTGVLVTLALTTKLFTCAAACLG